MTYYNCRQNRFLIFSLSIAILMVATLSLVPGTSAGDKKNVLILNSYHQGYKWTDEETQGALKALDAMKDNITIYIEYMGTKWVGDDQYFEQLHHTMKHKFRNVRFDVIILSDNDALNFMVKYRDDIFGKVPTVFCGINYFTDGDLKGQPLYTGINETADVKGTLEIALRLHPSIKKVIITNDTTITGRRLHDELTKVIPAFQDKVQFKFLEDIEMGKLLEEVEKLPSDSLILYTLFFRDKTGNFYEYDESISLIAHRAKVPVYGTWDFSFGYGIVGGLLTSGYDQGRAAGEMALRILKGEKIEDIPVVRQSPTRYMFDYHQMERFGIKRSALPPESVIINEPASLYEIHQGLVWGSVASISVLTFIIIVLLFNNHKRKEAERALRKARDELETRVQERTFELEMVNRLLVNEIADRKRATEALKKSEGNLSDIVEFLPDATFVIELEGKVIAWNRAIEEMTGIRKEEMIGQRDHAYSIPFYGERRRQLLDLIDVSDKELESKYKSVQRKGNTLYAEAFAPALYGGKGAHFWATGAPLFDGSGNRVGAIESIRDITERYQMEEEKRRLEERLNRAEKMEALGTLAGGVAHDLNNVLGVVVGYAELLLMNADKSSPIRPQLVSIMNGGQRAAAIVDDLLTLARRGVSGREVLNLNKIIADCRQSPEFEKLSSYHSPVKIRTDLEPDLLNISGSSVHLGKTLFNLVSNASEAMPKGGGVTIKTANQYLDKPIHGYDEVRTGDYVVLSVSDTGEGIHEADLKRIFEPFYTKKEMGRSGTGLGLAVVWGTVKDHQGYLNVESEEGKGSVFTLYFPVTREDISSEAVAVTISEYMGSGESILVVDDVKEQRDLAAGMLRTLNYSITSVSSGEEAVAYLMEHQADLMLLDMIMDPGMDGLDTYRSILKINPRQKAIIVSGFSESDRVKAAQDLGAGAYVRKPYIVEKLGLAVKKELDRSV
jgi:PAS domain S-box-containing protein